MNLNKLKGKIVEAGMTQQKVAGELGISLKSLNAKLNNRSRLTIGEVMMLKKVLKIDNPEEIFFK